MKSPIYNSFEEEAYKKWKLANAKFLKRYLRELEGDKRADETMIGKVCKWL